MELKMTNKATKEEITISVSIEDPKAAKAHAEGVMPGWTAQIIEKPKDE